MSYTVPNNLVSQYNAGQRQADPSKIDENFNYCTTGLNAINTLVTTAAAEGVNGIAQIATQAIAQAATDDTNKFLNALKGKYLVQAMLNAVGNLGTSYALTAPVAWADQITGGVYYIPSNAGNTGGPSTDAYHLIVCHYGDSDVAQVAIPAITAAYPQWRVKIGGTWSDWKPFVSTPMASCSTTGSTADKVASVTGFSLVRGARVFVTFTNANTVAGALTLDVNSTGAKPIYLGNSAASATNPFFIPAGVALEFVYNGTAWVHASCIIESWENSSRQLWYKKWSDGLIEQGIAGNGPGRVTFPTPFLRSDKTRFYKIGLLSSNTTGYSPTFVIHSDSLTWADVSARADGVGNSGLSWTLEVSGY